MTRGGRRAVYMEEQQRQRVTSWRTEENLGQSKKENVGGKNIKEGICVVVLECCAQNMTNLPAEGLAASPSPSHRRLPSPSARTLKNQSDGHKSINY